MKNPSVIIVVLLVFGPSSLLPLVAEDQTSENSRRLTLFGPQSFRLDLPTTPNIGYSKEQRDTKETSEDGDGVDAENIVSAFGSLLSPLVSTTGSNIQLPATEPIGGSFSERNCSSDNSCSRENCSSVQELELSGEVDASVESNNRVLLSAEKQKPQHLNMEGTEVLCSRTGLLTCTNTPQESPAISKAIGSAKTEDIKTYLSAYQNFAEHHIPLQDMPLVGTVSAQKDDGSNVSYLSAFVRFVQNFQEVSLEDTTAGEEWEDAVTTLDEDKLVAKQQVCEASQDTAITKNQNKSELSTCRRQNSYTQTSAEKVKMRHAETNTSKPNRGVSSLRQYSDFVQLNSSRSQVPDGTTSSSVQTQYTFVETNFHPVKEVKKICHTCSVGVMTSPPIRHSVHTETDKRSLRSTGMMCEQVQTCHSEVMTSPVRTANANVGTIRTQYASTGTTYTPVKMVNSSTEITRVELKHASAGNSPKHYVAMATGMTPVQTANSETMVTPQKTKTKSVGSTPKKFSSVASGKSPISTCTTETEMSPTTTATVAIATSPVKVCSGSTVDKAEMTIDEDSVSK